MKLLKAHGEYPKVIYRVFDKYEYAKDFINGKIRFSKLSYYTGIEDIARKDITEGESHIIYDESKHYHSRFASNSFYILCFHKTLETAKQSKFGKYIVEINEPKNLAGKISNYLSIQSDKHFGGIEGVNIDYSFGEKISKKPTSVLMAKLTYSQKPPMFSEENEFRFIFIKEHSEIQHVFIVLEDEIHDCKILDL